MSVARLKSSREDSPGRLPSIAGALETVVRNRLRDGTSGLKADVAKDLGLGTADLDGALRKNGTSFTREIRTLRLRLAQEALTETNTPISTIASELGFSEAANFTRFFKSETGMNPREYRKSKQAQL